MSDCSCVLKKGKKKKSSTGERWEPTRRDCRLFAFFSKAGGNFNYLLSALTSSNSFFFFLPHSFSLFWSFPLFSNLFSLTLPDHLSLILNIISSVNLQCTVGQPLQRAQQWSLATRVFVYLPSVPSYHCHDNQPVAMPIFRCNRIVFVQAVCVRAYVSGAAARLHPLIFPHVQQRIYLLSIPLHGSAVHSLD